MNRKSSRLSILLAYAAAFYISPAAGKQAQISMETDSPIADKGTFDPIVGDATLVPTMGDSTWLPTMGDATLVPTMGDATWLPTMGDSITFVPTMGDATSLPTDGGTNEATDAETEEVTVKVTVRATIRATTASTEKATVASIEKVTAEVTNVPDAVQNPDADIEENVIEPTANDPISTKMNKSESSAPRRLQLRIMPGFLAMVVIGIF